MNFLNLEKNQKRDKERLIQMQRKLENLEREIVHLERKIENREFEIQCAKVRGDL